MMRTLPNVLVECGALAPRAKGAVALFFHEDPALLRHELEEAQAAFGGHLPFLGTDSFRGKPGDLCTLSPSSMEGRALIAVGLGKQEVVSVETLRRASAAAAKECARLKVDHLTIQVPNGHSTREGSDSWQETIGSALADGSLLALYSYDKYRSTATHSTVRSIVLRTVSKPAVAPLRAGAARSRVICEGTWFARDLANAPGNELYPAHLAAVAQASGKHHGFKVTVFNESRIKRLGMGGLEGVGKGSARPPRFIILEYGTKKKGRGPVVLVGKGVTFDAGGISIKPSANMAEMKMDMSGAAAVLGTFQTIARLKLPLHVIGLLPVAENLPGGRALKPGDILRHLNGKTSEIDNTDAEGRLILADALAFAARYSPAAVIDLATLTGAVVVALGHVATGMFGTDVALMERLSRAGDETYERVWRLPLFEEYEHLIKSDIADVKNVGGRWAGAITGALFLKHFVGPYPWVHLDIAGTAILEEPQDYAPKGASGVGVRLLTAFLRSWNTKK